MSAALTLSGRCNYHWSACRAQAGTAEMTRIFVLLSGGAWAMVLFGWVGASDASVFSFRSSSDRPWIHWTDRNAEIIGGRTAMPLSPNGI